MTAITSLPLTPEQCVAMRSEPDWLKMTPDQENLMKAAGPNETCIFYGDELLLLNHDQVLAIYEVAFKEAANAATKLLGVAEGSNFEIDCEQPKLGQMYLRVTATDDLGKSASAIGMIPDPRAH